MNHWKETAEIQRVGLHHGERPRGRRQGDLQVFGPRQKPLRRLREAGLFEESRAVVHERDAVAIDREWVRRLLAAGLSYVGVLGPRDRRPRRA